MGRYELVRPTLRKRLLSKVFGNRRANSGLAQKFKSLTFSLLAFLFAGSYAMVTIVDPYGGALSSAYAFELDSTSDDQSYDYYSQLKVSFAREGWKIVTGDEAAAIYVRDAETPETGTVKEFAYTLVILNGWGRDQYSCLVALWERESNWRWNAFNKGSGAYGIPQALPAAKMAEMGSDWQTNPETQIKWGVNYIKHRYGAPCGAMAHSNKFNWY